MRDGRSWPTVLAALIVIAAVAAPALAGCSAQRRPSGGSGAEPSRPASPSADATSPTEPAALSDLTLELEPVASGLSSPVFVTHAGDGSGRIFIVEQGGLIKVARDGVVAPRPFLDVRAIVSSGGERGLLGLAFAADFKTSGRFYVNYTDRAGDTIVARYRAEDPSSDNPRISKPQVMLKVDQPYANHNGGCLAWAPDGSLWVGMGDGGSAGDPQSRAQNPRELLGKMLSLDVSGEGRPNPEIVASGLRNPWRFSFDRETDDLWIADVGQDDWEEIDYLPWADARGRNFGWNRWEGKHPYPPGSKQSRDGFTFPVLEYGHDEGISVTGGYVYRGSVSPALVGTYLYADFGSGRVWGARADSSGRVRNRLLLRDSGTAPSSFGEDEAGEVYLVDYNGRILRLTGR